MPLLRGFGSRVGMKTKSPRKEAARLRQERFDREHPTFTNSSSAFYQQKINASKCGKGSYRQH